MLKNIRFICFFLSPLAVAADVPPSDSLIQSIFIEGQENLSYLKTSEIEIKTAELLTIVLQQAAEVYTTDYRIISEEKALNEDTATPYQLTHLPVIHCQIPRKGQYHLQIRRYRQEQDMETVNLSVNVNRTFIGDWTFFVLLGLYLLLLFGGAIYLILLSNNRNKEKLLDLRSDWTNKLHNDVGGDLSSVSMRLDILKKKIAPLGSQMNEEVLKTYHILKDIQKKLRFVFNLVDPKKDSFHVMLEDVIDFARENLDLQGIEFHLQNDLLPEADSKIDIGRINKLYLVLKEVINNCLKSSQATNVNFGVSHDKKGILITIKDDGVGFDPAQTYEGNGLRNLRQYAREGLIELTINSAPGQGTTIKLRVPFL